MLPTRRIQLDRIASSTKNAHLGPAVIVGPDVIAEEGYVLAVRILEDKSANGGNVLTRSVLAKLPPFDGPKVIYCAGCLLGRDRLQAEQIVVRQTPYEIRVS